MASININPAEIISSVAGVVEGLVGQWRQARKERRDTLANFFDEVSICVTNTSNIIRAGEGDIAQCATKLGVIATQLPIVTRNVSRQEQREIIEQLAKDMESAADLEVLDAVRKLEPAAKEDQLRGLAKAAGAFEGVAMTLRAA